MIYSVFSGGLRFIVPVAILLLFGLIMVMSASVEYSTLYYDSPYYLIIKQSLLMMIGVLALILAIRISTSFWQDHSMMILLFNIGLLILVFLPFLGKEVNSSVRWISILGFSFQPSELLKLSMPIFYASYFSYIEASKQKLDISKIAAPFFVLALIVTLLLLQPDYASSIIYMVFAAAIIFFAGLSILSVSFIGFSILTLGLITASVQPYRLERFLCMQDANIWENFYSQCYQIGQSLVAIERGGIWGSGIGQSIQKTFYLPEAYTDFVFSIMVEEVGSVFAIFIIVVFVLLIYYIFSLGLRAIDLGNLFGGYLCLGFAVIWAIQFVLNIGVSLSYFPVTGLTLPFISYGGSSLVVNLMVLGIILRVAYDSKMLEERKRSINPSNNSNYSSYPGQG